MNARTARLLRRYAKRNNLNLNDLKRTWNTTPRNKRNAARHFIVEDLLGL